MTNTDTSTVSDAYAKMLTIFIPLLVDEVVILIDILNPHNGVFDIKTLTSSAFLAIKNKIK